MVDHTFALPEVDDAAPCLPSTGVGKFAGGGEDLWWCNATYLFPYSLYGKALDQRLGTRGQR
jgi:hypothetical protein